MSGIGNQLYAIEGLIALGGIGFIVYEVAKFFGNEPRPVFHIDAATGAITDSGGKPTMPLIGNLLGGSGILPRIAAQQNGGQLVNPGAQVAPVTDPSTPHPEVAQAAIHPTPPSPSGTPATGAGISGLLGHILPASSRLPGRAYM